MRYDQTNALNFETPNMRKRREFNYYYTGRDFDDALGDIMLKKVDNGEFWDNGYR